MHSHVVRFNSYSAVSSSPPLYNLGILKLFFRTNDEGVENERVITMSELRALANAAADQGISGRGHLLDRNDAIRSHYYGQSTWSITRLNSENFSKFFLCLDILFLAYSPESTHLVVQKPAETISNLLEYSWFFRLFRGFSYKNLQTQWDPDTCYISKESP